MALIISYEWHLSILLIFRFNLGAFYFATNMYQKANFQFTEALRVFEMFLGTEHEHTIASKEALKKLKAYIS